MKKGLCLLTIFLMSVPLLIGQTNHRDLEGTVTFITSENIYVRFDDASKIPVGDTLLLNENGILRPCLIVTNKSSISCVTVAINNCSVSKDMKVIFKDTSTDPIPIDTTTTTPKVDIDTLPPAPRDTAKTQNTKGPEQKTYGQLSVASYSNISPGDNSSVHRIVERGRLDIDHIAGSRFSFESYVNLNQTISTPQEHINQNSLRVYNLAVSYEIDNNLKVSLGRKINRNFASLGAIDGLQVEKTFDGLSIGGLVGSKPSFESFGYSPNLFLYGGFLGFNHRGNASSTRNTIGFIEQKNNSKTDRRYAYLQHYSSFQNKVSLFASAELDLFSGNVDTLAVQPRLTNLYLSLRYRLNRDWSLFASFDSRKQVIFFETYEATVEQILKDDLPNQGMRIRLNYYSNNNGLSGSLSYNIRIRDQRLAFTTINGNISYRGLPYLNGTATIYFAMNQSDYLNNNSISLSYKNKLFTDQLEGYLYYRLNTYKSRLFESVFRDQSYLGARLRYKINKDISIGILGEISFSTNQIELYRFNARIIKRFR